MRPRVARATPASCFFSCSSAVSTTCSDAPVSPARSGPLARWSPTATCSSTARRSTVRAYAVKLGDEITLRDKIHTLARDSMESLAGHMVPGWLAMNPAELTVKSRRESPTSDQIPFDVNTNLIVEFYR